MKKGTSITLILPDIHFPYQDLECIEVVKRFVRRYKPDRVVGLGDWADCTNASRHMVCNVQEQLDLALRDFKKDELEPLQQFCNYLLKYSGELILHEGNHEHRINTLAANNTFVRSIYQSIAPIHSIRHERMKWIPYSPPDRGLSYYEVIPESSTHTALWTMHGWSHSKSASQAHLDRVRYRVSCCHGHVHRATRTQIHTEPHGGRSIKAWSPGCLSEKRFYYQHGKPGEATHGFTVVYSRRGAWQEFHVEIQNGQAILPDGVLL